MAEILVKFTECVRDDVGREYLARACGGPFSDGLWHGWIEFVSDEDVIRTPRETEQPNRTDLLYWAQGLSIAYLEGALDRARRDEASRTQDARSKAPSTPVTRSSFESPSPDRWRENARPEPAPLLDPFKVFAQGEAMLRQQLLALSPDHLRTLMLAYHLGDDASRDDPRDIGHVSLAERIVEGVRKRIRTG